MRQQAGRGGVALYCNAFVMDESVYLEELLLPRTLDEDPAGPSALKAAHFSPAIHGQPLFVGMVRESDLAVGGDLLHQSGKPSAELGFSANWDV